MEKFYDRSFFLKRLLNFPEKLSNSHVFWVSPCTYLLHQNVFWVSPCTYLLHQNGFGFPHAHTYHTKMVFGFPHTLLLTTPKCFWVSPYTTTYYTKVKMKSKSSYKENNTPGKPETIQISSYNLEAIGFIQNKNIKS